MSQDIYVMADYKTPNSVRTNGEISDDIPLTVTVREVLSQTDAEYHLKTWEELKAIISLKPKRAFSKLVLTPFSGQRLV